MTRHYTAVIRRLLGTALLGSVSIAAMSLNLSQSYEGSTFFDEWTYNASDIDVGTQGNIQYVPFAAASLLALLFLPKLK